MGLRPKDALELTIGMSLSMLKRYREVENDRIIMEMERSRRSDFYASSWLDHSGKTASDLYPFPWEYDKKDAVDVDTAHAAALELQRRLNQRKDAIKE